MTRLDDHPTVRAIRAKRQSERNGSPATLTVSARNRTLDAEEIRRIALDCGADDAGIVPIDHPLLADERHRIEAAFPAARSLVAVCCRMQPENVRSPLRSVANQAFHNVGHEVDDVCRRLVFAMADRSVRACNPSMAFPMEIKNIPEDRPWIVSHKLVAEAAGLGVRGIHRNVIHPKFGNFILLGTVLLDIELDAYSEQLDYNPCVECKLCVAACPVGAIKPDGHFDTVACTTHNYREFLGGFSDWIDSVTDAKSSKDYRDRVDDGETLSMWQSIAFGPNYNAAYCLAVCPAGEDVMAPFLDDRPSHVRGVVKPLQQRKETLYVIAGSDAEAHAEKYYPHKPRKRVHNGIRPTTIPSFLDALPWMFQRGQSTGLDATYHFTFTGKEPGTATIRIVNRTIVVSEGHQGTPDARVSADSAAWIAFLRRDQPLWKLLLTMKLRLSPLPRAAKLLQAFGRCFPA